MQTGYFRFSQRKKVHSKISICRCTWTKWSIDFGIFKVWPLFDGLMWDQYFLKTFGARWGSYLRPREHVYKQRFKNMSKNAQIFRLENAELLKNSAIFRRYQFSTLTFLDINTYWYCDHTKLKRNILRSSQALICTYEIVFCDQFIKKCQNFIWSN